MVSSQPRGVFMPISLENLKRKYLGTAIGGYKIIDVLDEKNKFGTRYYLCKCHCGNEKKNTMGNLNRNKPKSCGCYEGSLEQRKNTFFKNVDKTDSCWNWIGCKNDSGYGVMAYNKKAHRFSFHIHTGADPKDKMVLHKCDNPACVNPDHLYLGNDKDNMRDKIERNRHPKGSKSVLSKINESDVFNIKKMRKESKKLHEIANKYKISEGNVSLICNNKTWRHCCE